MIDKLVQSVKSAFEQVSDHRYKNARIGLGGYLQSAFAMFHSKDPSLHHYRLNYPEREANLERVHRISFLPSDAAMREGIDGIAPSEIQDCFKIPLQGLDEQGVMEGYQVLGGYQSILFDGTQHYCTAKALADIA